MEFHMGTKEGDGGSDAATMKPTTRGTHEWGGFYPADTYSPWPPKTPVGFSIDAVAKRLHAFFTRGTLIWLRDFDECQSLTVAHRNFKGDLVAPRMWPFYREVILLEDGNVYCPHIEDQFVRHWIEANQTRMIFMLLQNSEVYAEEAKE
jgi:hypothetical protein